MLTKEEAKSVNLGAVFCLLLGDCGVLRLAAGGVWVAAASG